MTLAKIGLWIMLICFINFMSFTFLKRMNASIELKDAYSPFVLKVAKIPPFAFLIALFLILFG